MPQNEETDTTLKQDDEPEAKLNHPYFLKIASISTWFENHVHSVQAISSIALAFLTLALVIYSFAALQQSKRNHELQKYLLDIEKRNFIADHTPLIQPTMSNKKPYILNEKFHIQWRMNNLGKNGIATDFANYFFVMYFERDDKKVKSTKLIFSRLTPISRINPGSSRWFDTVCKNKNSLELLARSLNEEDSLIVLIITSYYTPKLYSIDEKRNNETIYLATGWSKSTNKFHDLNQRDFNIAINTLAKESALKKEQISQLRQQD